MLGSFVLFSLWHVAVSGSSVRDSDNSLFRKRAASTCSSSPYTTPDGLSFAVDCNSNMPGSDFSLPNTLTASDVYDCMRQCSVARPKCYGVSYNFDDGLCYRKNASIVGANINGNDQVTHSALVTPTAQLDSEDTTCPYADSATVKTDNGMSFQVHCSADIIGGDYCPPSTNSSCPAHASSLTDCMNQCSTSHPLCTGVSYNPDLTLGYANCYFKNNFARSGFNPVSTFITHAAVALVQNITTQCSVNQNATASNSMVFDLQCNQNRAGNDLTVYHEVSLQNCINNCATYTGNKCIGVIFDGNMELGWENCYLKSASGTPLYNSTAVFALATGVKDTSSGSSGSSSSSSGSSKASSSKAWIAGVVVAAIVVLALIAGFVIWRRRRANRSANAMTGGLVTEAGHQDHQPQQQYPIYGKVVGDNGNAISGDRISKTPLPVYTPPAELDSTEYRSELQGNGK